MFTIWYILDNRMEIVKCNTIEDVIIMKEKLIEMKANIRMIHDRNGTAVTIN